MHHVPFDFSHFPLGNGQRQKETKMVVRSSWLFPCCVCFLQEKKKANTNSHSIGKSISHNCPKLRKNLLQGPRYLISRGRKEGRNPKEYSARMRQTFSPSSRWNFAQMPSFFFSATAEIEIHWPVLWKRSVLRHTSLATGVHVQPQDGTRSAKEQLMLANLWKVPSQLLCLLFEMHFHSEAVYSLIQTLQRVA